MNSVHADDELVSEAILDLEAMLELENEGGKASWMELFRSNHMMWKRTLSESVDVYLREKWRSQQMLLVRSFRRVHASIRPTAERTE